MKIKPVFIACFTSLTHPLFQSPEVVDNSTEMFYSQQVLTKKGPLAKIWLAAHMQSKLTKAMVFSTDLRKAVESIISPEVPMALRLTSNLLLGVVRILHRKSKYLLQESSDAMTRLKLAFNPLTGTSLPTRQTTTANYNAITVQPALDSFETPNLDLEMLPARTVPTHASFLAADRDITIDEFAGGIVGGMLDAFALEIDLDRQDGVDSEANLSEPLLFTPSQRSIRQSPIVSSVRSDPSVEAMRAEASIILSAGQTPRLSTGLPSASPEQRDRERTDSDVQGPVPSLSDAEDPEVSRRAEALPVTAVDQPPFTPPRKVSSALSGPDDFGLPSSSGRNENISPDLPPVYPVEVPEDQDQQTPLNILPSTTAPQMPRFSTGTDDLTLAVAGAPVTPDAGMTPNVGETPEHARSATQDEDIDFRDPSQALITEAPASTPLSQSLPTDRLEGESQPQRGSPLSDEWHPPSASEGSSQVPESPAAPEITRGKERKRKAHVLFDEGATELSATDFRASLHDTSDLIRGPRAPTRRRVDPSLRQVDVLGLPAYLMAPPVRQIFEQNFLYEEVVSSPMSDAVGEEDLTPRDPQQQPTTGEGAFSVQQEGSTPAPESSRKTSFLMASPAGDLGHVPETPIQAPETPFGPEETVAVPVVSPELGLPGSGQAGTFPDGSPAPVQPVTPVPAVAETDVLEHPAIHSERQGEGLGGELQDTHQGVQVEIDNGATAEGTSSSKGASRTADLSEDRQPVSAEFHADSGKISLREVALSLSQMDRSTGETVTEVTLSARGLKMKEYIEEHSTEGKLNFSARLSLERGVSKRTASRTFYEMLNLSNKKAVRLSQDGAYHDIYVEPVQPYFSGLGGTSQ